MIGIAYVCALLFAVPQCVVWEVYELAPQWRQCVTLWKSESLRCVQEAAGRGHIAEECTTFVPVEQAYHIGHLVVVFFLPLLLIVICYTYVLLRMGQFSFRPESIQIRRKSTPYQAQDNVSDGDLQQLELEDFDPYVMLLLMINFEDRRKLLLSF